MLGLFDSGLGGLTVLRRVRELLPNADIVYFADQAHMPYGDRSEDDLLQLMRANVAWLNEQGCSAIVMACNTSCSVAHVHGWPESRARIFDLIESAAAAVVEQHPRSVAVVATAATVRAGAYSGAIARVSGIRVVEIAAPALVPLIESPATTPEAMRSAVAAVCAQLPSDMDALLYGCTHYPLIDDVFACELASNVARIDPAIVQARRVAAVTEAKGFASGGGTTRYVTTGELEPYRARVTSSNGRSSPVERISPLSGAR